MYTDGPVVVILIFPYILYTAYCRGGCQRSFFFGEDFGAVSPLPTRRLNDTQTMPVPCPYIDTFNRITRRCVYTKISDAFFYSYDTGDSGGCGGGRGRLGRDFVVRK